MLKNDRIGRKFITKCCITPHKVKSFSLFCIQNLKLIAYGLV